MNGHMFWKSVDLAYFNHNGSQTAMSGKGKVDFFESLGITSIIFDVKSSTQINAYNSTVSS